MPDQTPASPDGDGARAPDQSLPRRCRVLSSARFQQIMRQGVRLGDQHLLMYAAANGLAWTRLGLAVGKRHGNAIRRNRLKRICREAFRRIRLNLPAGLDLVLVPRAGEEPGAPELRASLLRLCGKAAVRLSDMDPGS